MYLELYLMPQFCNQIGKILLLCFESCSLGKIAVPYMAMYRYLSDNIACGITFLRGVHNIRVKMGTRNYGQRLMIRCGNNAQKNIMNSCMQVAVTFSLKCLCWFHLNVQILCDSSLFQVRKIISFLLICMCVP